MRVTEMMRTDVTTSVMCEGVRAGTVLETENGFIAQDCMGDKTMFDNPSAAELHIVKVWRNA